MAKQIINIGASANDGTGDPLRNAFDKTNDNFNELYLALGSSQNATSLFDINGNFDMGNNKSHKISFYYATEALLLAVDASDYHGCVGHAHDTGYLYYAHGGTWVKLAKYDDLGSGGGGGSSANTFGTIAISGQNSVVADSATDTLTLVAGTGVTLSSNATSDSITIASPVNNAFGQIAVAGQTAVAADTGTDLLTLVAGSNIVLTTNAAADSITISASGGGGSNSINLNSADAGVIDVAADSFAFIDANDSGNTKKESIADFVNSIAGANITASNGVLSAAAGYTNSDVDTHLNTGSAAASEVLSWTGSDYDWVAQSGGFTPARVTEGETTASIGNGSSGNIAFADLGKSFALYTVNVDKESWVRIYSDTASRTADASRTQGQDPSDGSGVIAEFVATSANTTFKVTPAVYGYIDNGETTLPVAVQNNSGSAGTITVTLTALKLES